MNLLVAYVRNLVLEQKVLDLVDTDPSLTIVVEPIKCLLERKSSDTAESLPLLLEVSLASAEGPE